MKHANYCVAVGMGLPTEGSGSMRRGQGNTNERYGEIDKNCGAFQE